MNSERAPFNLVLYEPVIPQNTGSIARLCACTGAALHLIHPLGFQVDEASVRRAGLDYWPFVKVVNHADWDAFMRAETPENIFFFSKWGTKSFWKESFPPPVYLVFGSETKGLPDSLRERFPGYFLKIAMRTDIVRSLNLAQAAAIVLYEALRQSDFSAGTEEGSGGSFPQ
ncbi:MAG: tRNA (cytidine(34)-2'-O)-methyltransferase [Proteobacteria bacterium]|nr:tRNA (cytidine(34)-2'-O)-methyltransferase [Pseudomonadota bacterium]